MAIAVTLAAVGQPALAETVTPVVEGCYYSPSAVPTAESAADFARLTRQLQFDEAASVFSRSGGLRQSVIPNSSPIIRGPQLGNQQVVKALTADGSNIADLQRLVNTPGAQRYYDTATGNINVIQQVDDVLLRISTATGQFKIISVGPSRPNRVTNGVANGRFVPIGGAG